MSASELEFTPVLSPRPSGIHRSGLFHHIQNNRNECIAQFTSTGDRSIIRVSRPPDMLLPGRKYILLHLNPQLITEDLFKYLPRETRDRYVFGTLELHITIDQEYGDKGTKLAEENLLWYSHITLQVCVGVKGYVACHIYVDDGVVRAVRIKEPNINAYQPDDVIVSKAHALAKKPLEIICAAIKHMQKHRDSLEEQLTEKLSDLFNISIMSSLSQQDKLLEEAKELQHEIRLYSEGFYANRYQHAERFIRERRSGIIRSQAFSISSDSVTLEAASSAVSQEEERIETGSPCIASSFGSVRISDFSPSAFSSRSFGESISVSPMLELSAQDKSLPAREREKLLIESINSRFKQLKEKAAEYKKNKLVGTKVEQVYKYYVALQDLRMDAAAADICASEKYRPAANTLNTLANQLLDKGILDFYIQQLNVAGVKKFFGEFKSQLDWKFYLAFQIRIQRPDLTDQEENNAVEICEIFFKHDPKYRKCLSGTYKGFHNTSGEEVSILSIVGLIWRATPRTKLFSCIVKHAGAHNLEGFVDKYKNTAPLLYVVCSSSSSEDCGEAISALLETENPSIEARGSFFAMGTQTALIDVLGSEGVIDNERYDVCNDTFKCTPYMGSALYAYMSSEDVRIDILERLSKLTSTMHLMMGLARFSKGNAQQRNYCSTEKHGVDIGKEIVLTEKIRLAQEAAISRAKYYSCLIACENSGWFSMLNVLYLEVKSRLAKTSEKELQVLITNLQENATYFKGVNNHEMAPSCYQAILYLCMYLEPSAKNHKLIATTCLDLCDTTIAAKRASGADEADLRHKHCEGYVEAIKFVDNSIYRDALKELSTSVRVAAVMNVNSTSSSSRARTFSVIKE